MKHLNELQALNLPNGMFAISGSAPMSIRSIRPANDLDIIVKNDLWENLIKKYKNNLNEKEDCLNIGNIEIYKNWLNLSDKIDEMIDTAEIFDGLPFVKLRYVQQWKKYLNREKDLKDLELIEKYLQKKEFEDSESSSENSVLLKKNLHNSFFIFNFFMLYYF